LPQEGQNAPSRLDATTGYPATIRVDNDPEFVSRDLDLWAFRHGVTPNFSRPGKPTDDAFFALPTRPGVRPCLPVLLLDYSALLSPANLRP